MRPRSLTLLVLAVALCSSLFAQAPSAPAASAQASERLSADTPKTTVLGNPFVAPREWSIRIKGQATILEAPEGDSWIALVDVQAKENEDALAAAWQAYKPEAKWPVKVSHDLPDKDGWSRRRVYEYLNSPNERRVVTALAYYSGISSTVIIQDLSAPVAEKRTGQVALIMGRLLPKGYTRESFAGKKANVLDSVRIAELRRFIEQGQKATGVPGTALGLVQDGKVIFAGGFGVKDLGGTEKPDAETLFMVASNTKAMTTLLLAKLVDEHRIAWDTPVTTLFPSFRLGSADTTRSVLVKHLVHCVTQIGCY
jgi:hypothetical protein